MSLFTMAYGLCYIMTFDNEQIGIVYEVVQLAGTTRAVHLLGYHKQRSGGYNLGALVHLLVPEFYTVHPCSHMSFSCQLHAEHEQLSTSTFSPCEYAVNSITSALLLLHSWLWRVHAKYDNMHSVAKLLLKPTWNSRMLSPSLCHCFYKPAAGLQIHVKPSPERKFQCAGCVE